MKKILRVFLVCLAFFTPSYDATANSQPYLFTDLGTLGGANSVAFGINERGQIVGSADTTGSAATHAFLYSNGSMLDLGTLGGKSSAAFDINNRGQVVGSADTTPGGIVTFPVNHAFLYSDGSMQDLGSAGGEFYSTSVARAINDHGQAVGSTDIFGNIDRTGIIYSNGNMQTVFLPGPGGSFIDINARGQVVGSAFGLTYLYTNGNLQSLGTLGGEQFPGSSASGINDLGQVVGRSSLEGNSGIGHAFLYSNGSMQDLGTLGGATSFANDINNRGQVVGYSVTIDGFQHATLWNDGSILDVNSFLDASTIADGWILTNANDINDRGWIVGTAHNSISGDDHAFVIAAVPEPESYAMMFVGLGILTFVGWRRRNLPLDTRHAVLTSSNAQIIPTDTKGRMIMRNKVAALLFSLLTMGLATHAYAQGCSSVDQIAPNPNPIGSTITNTSPTACNGLAKFDNAGTLNNDGTLTNTGTLWTSGEFYNNGTFNNDGFFTRINNVSNSQPTAFVNTGTINNSASFSLQAPLRNEGTLNNYGNFGSGDGFLVNTGTLNNYSRFLNACCASVSNDGALNNYGSIETREWGFNNNSVLNNVGTFDITSEGPCAGPDRPCGNLTNTGTLNNTGTVNNGGKVFNDGLINNSGQFLSPKFVLGTGNYVQTTGTTRVDGSMTQATFNIKGGILQGTGTITGAVTLDGGRLAPGNSPGVLTIFGDYTQTMRGSFEAQIGGLQQGTEYDVLHVTGKATLAGLLDVSLFDLGDGLFSPHAGDTFDILSAENIIGRFNTLLFTPLGKYLQWEVAYLKDAYGTTDVVRLQVAAVPEPEIYAMLVIGLGVVGFVGWRRRKAALSIRYAALPSRKFQIKSTETRRQMIMRSKIAAFLISLLTMGIATHVQAQGCSAVDQIAPNPNPVGNTITNTSGTACNRGSTFINKGALNNKGLLYNQSSGFDNFGTINNEGRLQSDGFIHNYGDLNNGGTLGNANSMFNIGTLTNNGTFLTGGGLFGNSGTLINNGALLTGGNTSIGNSEGGTWINNGTMTIGFPSSEGYLFNEGLLWNLGSVTGNGPGALPTPVGIIQVAGTLRNDGSIMQERLQIRGGVLQGTGTITGIVDVDEGRVAPGNSPGILTIFGDYTQSMRGSFEAQIGGVYQGMEYDVLRISGKATLAGVLDVSLLNLGNGVFSPHEGDTFDILSAETIIGSFNTVLLAPLRKNLEWEVSYVRDAYGTTDVVRLQVAAVPEPEIYAMMAIGLGVLGFVGRRRRRASYGSI